MFHSVTRIVGTWVLISLLPIRALDPEEYSAMKSLHDSGWFGETHGTPCVWFGVECEKDHVFGLCVEPQSLSAIHPFQFTL